MTSKRTKATDISQKIKRIVWERDNEKCIMCGSRYAMPNAHYIRRSQGGLGIEENIVTLCRNCHDAFDEGERHDEIKEQIKEYLKYHYPNWNEDLLYYKKGY